MELRTGKYGDFFYCRDHGTISKRAADALMGHDRPPSFYTCSHPPKIDLLDDVHRMSVAFGGSSRQNSTTIKLLNRCFS